MEIEKKYMIKQLPGNIRNGVAISQGYVVSEGGKELRIRKKADQCYLTAKGDGNLSREEWEVEIPEWVFDILWPKTEGHRVEKVRYAVPTSDGLVMEFDEYSGNLKGLLTLEIEFPSEDKANAFALPSYIVGIDVTCDKRFKNKNLATIGSIKLLV